MSETIEKSVSAKFKRLDGKIASGSISDFAEFNLTKNTFVIVLLDHQYFDMFFILTVQVFFV